MDTRFLIFVPFSFTLTPWATYGHPINLQTKQKHHPHADGVHDGGGEGI